MRAVHHSEYLALSLLLIGAAIWQKDLITPWFWFWPFAPDLFGLVPTFLFGRSANPWPLLGWLLHVSLDRLVGFGLRGDDGGQAVI